ncbi:hypothetical protein DAEQUDRAFT_727789 [Daedalea quercina L-15889]|uniref:Uncharacterized protein n=1 Tax=Daedalea quercina L-15889 TaxID=1314783 RepID=A0A165PP03_9APHY|nr:hypothetical protein DAEQUDRAFT_727789 [Daedalea quercina L-15889]
MEVVSFCSRPGVRVIRSECMPPTRIGSLAISCCDTPGGGSSDATTELPVWRVHKIIRPSHRNRACGVELLTATSCGRYSALTYVHKRLSAVETPHRACTEAWWGLGALYTTPRSQCFSGRRSLAKDAFGDLTTENPASDILFILTIARGATGAPDPLRTRSAKVSVDISFAVI